MRLVADAPGRGHGVGAAAAAVIILVTGAGGAFGRILTETGLVGALADVMGASDMPVLLLPPRVAALVADPDGLTDA